MELALNLAWLLLAAIMFSMWLQFSRRTGLKRQTQLVALAALVLILFPVISVTDDLQAALNPAEDDCCLRRDHAFSTPHSIFSPVAELPLPAFTGLPFGSLRTASPGIFHPPGIDHLAKAPIRNRPPPDARPSL